MPNLIGGFQTYTGYFVGNFFGHFFTGDIWNPPIGNRWLALHRLEQSGTNDWPAEISAPGYERIPLLMDPREDGGVGYNAPMMFPRALADWPLIGQYGIWDDGPTPGSGNCWFYSPTHNSPQLNDFDPTTATTFTVPKGHRLRVPRRTIQLIVSDANSHNPNHFGFPSLQAAAVWEWLYRAGPQPLPMGPGFNVTLLHSDLSVVAGPPTPSCTITTAFSGSPPFNSGTNAADISFGVAAFDWVDVSFIKLTDLGGEIFGPITIFHSAPFSGSNTIFTGESFTIPHNALVFGLTVEAA